VLVSGLLAAPAPGHASSGDEPGSTGELDIGVPGEVYEVRTLGTWRDGARAGTYRVVTLRGGLDHVRTDVLIQWMEQGLGEAVPSVVATQRVELLDDLGPITVPAVRETAPAPNQLHVSIQTRHRVSGEEGNVEAVAGPPGQLTSEFAPIK
jgi:hypothetical protein